MCWPASTPAEVLLRLLDLHERTAHPVKTIQTPAAQAENYKYIVVKERRSADKHDKWKPMNVEQPVAHETETEVEDKDQPSCSGLQQTTLTIKEGRMCKRARVTSKEAEICEMPEKELEKKSRIFGKDGKDSKLNKYQQAINKEAFLVAKERPDLVYRRGELLTEARLRLHASGYSYKRGSQSRSKVLGKMEAEKNVLTEDRLREINEEMETEHLGVEEKDQPSCSVLQQATINKGRICIGAPVTSEEAEICEMTENELEEKSRIFGNDGKEGKLNKYQQAINKEAFLVAKERPDLVYRRGELLKEARLRLHAAGYSYKRRNESRSKVFGKLEAEKNVLTEDRLREINEEMETEHLGVEEKDQPSCSVLQQATIKKGRICTRAPVTSEEAEICEMTEKELEEKSQIFGKDGKDGKLNKYQQAINKEAFLVAKERPDLVYRRGELLKEARLRLHASGYSYKRGSQSRSKIFGKMKAERNASTETHGIEFVEVRLREINEEMETEHTEAEENYQPSCSGLRQATLTIKKGRMCTGAPVTLDQAEICEMTENELEQKSQIFGKDGKDGKMNKYQQAINKEAFLVAKERPDLVYRRGELLKEARLRLHASGYSYKRGSQSRSKVFGKMEAEKNVLTEDRLREINEEMETEHLGVEEKDQPSCSVLQQATINKGRICIGAPVTSEEAEICEMTEKELEEKYDGK